MALVRSGPLPVVAMPLAASDVEAERAAIWKKVDALTENASGKTDAERLNEYIQLFFDYTMLEHPEFATYIGLPGDHGRWTDNSLAAEARREAETKRGLEVLKTIDRDKLEGEDRPRVAWVRSAASYLSASDPRVHFAGLGEVDEERSIVVTWRDGARERFPVTAGTYTTIRRGEGQGL